MSWYRLSCEVISNLRRLRPKHVVMDDFLKSRNCDVDKLKEHNIDEFCVGIMSDSESEVYVPKYGDRLALKSFLKNRNKKTSSSHDK